MLNNNKNWSVPSPKLEKTKEEIIREQRSALYDALKNINEDLANIYTESINVLNQSKNSFRFNLSAHGIRTLINRIPDTINIPTEQLRIKRFDKMNSLIEVLKKNIEKTSCKINSNYEGKIDAPIKKMLKVIEKFYKWDKEHSKRRKEELVETLKNLDYSPIRLPEQLEIKYTDIFDNIRGFFIKVAHDTKFNEEEIFGQYLYAFNRFMLEKLGYKTITGLNNIDALIEEGQEDD